MPVKTYVAEFQHWKVTKGTHPTLKWEVRNGNGTLVVRYRDFTQAVDLASSGFTKNLAKTQVLQGVRVDTTDNLMLVEKYVEHMWRIYMEACICDLDDHSDCDCEASNMARGFLEDALGPDWHDICCGQFLNMEDL